MKNIAGFAHARSYYWVAQLSIEDTAILQTLYDRNRDFALLTYGQPFSITAAKDEFDDLPLGKTSEDIHVFGLFELKNSLVGAIFAVRGYPDKYTWWIGLMMLAPEYRSRGLGSSFYRTFEIWLFAKNIRQISLCVIKANQTGLKFWQKLGFKNFRQTLKYYGNKTHIVYVLSKAIAHQSNICADPN